MLKENLLKLHDIIDRKGWTDYAAEEDTHITYVPATRTLMTRNGGLHRNGMY